MLGRAYRTRALSSSTAAQSGFIARPRAVCGVIQGLRQTRSAQGVGGVGYPL